MVVVADEVFGAFSSFGRPRTGRGGVVHEEENDETKSGDEAVTQNRHHRLRILHVFGQVSFDGFGGEGGLLKLRYSF